MSNPRVRCTRCGRAIRARERSRTNVTLKGGVVVGVTCPRCQTAEEDLEAQVNLATTEYGADALGRVRGRPKGT